MICLHCRGNHHIETPESPWSCLRSIGQRLADNPKLKPVGSRLRRQLSREEWANLVNRAMDGSNWVWRIADAIIAKLYELEQPVKTEPCDHCGKIRDLIAAIDAEAALDAPAATSLLGV